MKGKTTKTTKYVKKAKQPKYKTKKIKPTTTVLFFDPKNSGLIVPPKFFTKVRQIIDGSVPAGVGMTIQVYNIGMSYIQTPFATLSGYSGWPNPFSSLTGTSVVGIKNLLFNTTTNSGLYQSYRVHGVKTKILFMPQALSDTSNCAVTCHTGATPFTTYNTAVDAPYAKTKIMNANQTKDNVITYYMKNRTVRGQTKQQFNDDPNNTGTYTNNPTNVIVMDVYLIAQDGVNLIANMGYQVEVEYFIELFAPVSQNLIQV